MKNKRTHCHKLVYPTDSFGHIPANPGGAVLILTTAPSVNAMMQINMESLSICRGEYRFFICNCHSSSELPDLLLVVNIYFGYMNCFIYKRTEFVI